ncbi:MAG: hypothetical protein DRP65_10195 [Planctomycetota bacterium]|nr:MAG: hypothetical protein DRP65_10195 [Planctomycetota bacterium]
MTLYRILQGTLVATFVSKITGEHGRIYMAPESRGYKTGYRPKDFFWLVPFTNNGVPRGNWLGISRDARRRTIEQHSDVAVVDRALWQRLIK